MLKVTQFFGILILKLIVKSLYFVEKLGSLPERLVFNGLRLFLYFVVFLSLLTNFYLKSENAGDFFVSYLPRNVGVARAGVLGVRAARNIPKFVETVEFPPITSRSVYAADIKHNRVLVNFNSDIKSPPASVTKLLTSLVALEIYQLEESLYVPYFCTEVEGQKAGLLAEDQVRVEDLLNLLLIGSAGDAACVLANSALTQEVFVEKMNLKAMEIGLHNSGFTNPIGLDDDNGLHYSTAYDLYLLSRVSIQNALIKEIVKVSDYTMQTASGQEVHVQNTNQLLGYIPNTAGIKTGRTAAAGEVLSYLYVDDEKEILIVVMGSEDRFSDTQAVLNWILKSYSWDI